MVGIEKLWQRVLSGRSDANVRFGDLCKLLFDLGFSRRLKGDHHIFTRPDVEEIINLQPKGSQAKPYQVKQVRELILRHGLGPDTNDEI